MGILRTVTLTAAALAGYRALVRGDLTLDLGVGRRTRPLVCPPVDIEASREVVFDVIAQPYLGRMTRAQRDKIDVVERGSDMVLAAHRTPVSGGLVTTTLETVRFERPERIHFRLVRGPVPFVVEQFVLAETGTGTASSTPARWAPTCGASAIGGGTGSPRPGRRRSRRPSPA